MEKVIIPNKKEFEKKKEKILREGKEKLHIISDFDKTLTKAFVKGKKVLSLIAYLRNGKYLTKDYAPRAHELFNKYHPIEINPDFPKEEKIKKMREWWETHFKLLVECGLDKRTIKKAIRDMDKDEEIKFREGALEFLDLLHTNEIPIVIMSASIGDMIKELLKLKGGLYSNMYIIANLLEFNERGKFVKIENIIHSMNKKEIEVEKLPFFEKIKERKNIILLGDQLGDLEMTEDEEWETVLKIGFLNENIEEQLDDFKKGFDVIITGDSDMNFVVDILKEIG